MTPRCTDGSNVSASFLYDEFGRKDRVTIYRIDSNTCLAEALSGCIVHGFNEDLNLATREAALGMLTLLTDRQRLSRDDAYSLMSVAADFGVTQVVDSRRGIYARIPRGIFPSQLA